MFTDPLAEATFVPADLPRDGALALWSPVDAIEGADAELEVVLPSPVRPRRRTVPARIVPLRDVLDDLVELPASRPVRPSVRAWSAVTRIAVELVARGRLLPDITPAGEDAWRLGPLDPEDLVLRGQLSSALPPEAHARLVGLRPLRVASPDRAVADLSDAVADLLPRVAGAETAVGHEAFAAMTPTDLHGTDVWFRALGGEDDEAMVAMRLEPPTEEDGRFAGVIQLQSRRDPSLVVDAFDLWSAPEVVLERFGDAESTLLLALRRAARVWPPIRRLLDQPRPTWLGLRDEDVDELMGPVVEDLAAAGVHVLWPAALDGDPGGEACRVLGAGGVDVLGARPSRPWSSCGGRRRSATSSSPSRSCGPWPRPADRWSGSGAAGCGPIRRPWRGSWSAVGWRRARPWRLRSVGP